MQVDYYVWWCIGPP